MSCYFNFFILEEINCWDYTSKETCLAHSDKCIWKEDPWGGWCEEKNCWSLFTVQQCINSNNTNSEFFINRTCIWNTASYSWCTEIDCWVFDGTNESYCENNPQ